MDHSCSCKAGQGICNHRVALMYQAAHYSLLKIDTVPQVPSKTSIPQEWHKPRSAGIHPGAVDNLFVRKPELKSEGSPKCKKRARDGVKSNLYNPIQNYPNSEFIREFLARANTDYKETQFATSFSEGELEYVECNYGTLPKGCVVSYQVLSSFYAYIRGIPYLPYQQSCLITYVAMFFHAHRLMYLFH